MNRKEILNRAEEIINGDREGTYGKPEDSFDRIARLWSVYLNHDVSSVDVANMMVLLKVARNSGGVYKDDNWIDICGYAALGGEIQSRFDYDSFGQFMNKPEESEELKNNRKHSGRYPWNENFMNVKPMEFDDFLDIVTVVTVVTMKIYVSGVCTIDDYYFFCEDSSVVYLGDAFGWTDPDVIGVQCVEQNEETGKWVIKMPAAIRLDKGENE